ncbi:myb/SANT-like DNA-binding domain-containing protein 3, partial [Anneissia japonica]|uniref:myb/SANT-like DNA-binding domain-containing protein 3 n=1 Tax=Anneissia japonica TaxID=1529436 RepID=UPI001425A209
MHHDGGFNRFLLICSSLASNRTPTTATTSPIATGSPMKVTPHMSEVERNILMALVNQYRDAIESRRNDSTAVQRKAIAWAYVEKEYNTQPMVRNQRTKKQLRKAYENLKMRSKKDIMKKQKLVKPEQERRPMPISAGSSMPVGMTESEIPAEIRTLLNPYDADDNTYHGETSTSNHD